MWYFLKCWDPEDKLIDFYHWHSKRNEDGDGSVFAHSIFT